MVETENSSIVVPLGSANTAASRIAGVMSARRSRGDADLRELRSRVLQVEAGRDLERQPGAARRIAAFEHQGLLADPARQHGAIRRPVGDRETDHLGVIVGEARQVRKSRMWRGRCGGRGSWCFRFRRSS